MACLPAWRCLCACGVQRSPSLRIPDPRPVSLGRHLERQPLFLLDPVEKSVLGFLETMTQSYKRFFSASIEAERTFIGLGPGGQVHCWMLWMLSSIPRSGSSVPRTRSSWTGSSGFHLKAAEQKFRWILISPNVIRSDSRSPFPGNGSSSSGRTSRRCRSRSCSWSPPTVCSQDFTPLIKLHLPLRYFLICSGGLVEAWQGQ